MFSNQKNSIRKHFLVPTFSQYSAAGFKIPLVRALTLKPSALEGLTKIWHQAAEQVAYVKKRHPEVTEIFGDVAMAVTGGSQHNAARSLRRLSDQYPEVGPNWSHLKFKGRGQRDTCVTDAKGIVEVIMLLPGQQAARARVFQRSPPKLPDGASFPTLTA